MPYKFNPFTGNLDYYQSATATNFVNNEIVAGSGTTFTFANTPVTGSQQVYGKGQRLYPTTDYSFAGVTGGSPIGLLLSLTYAANVGSTNQITTVNTWSAGDILADYRY
jgi:hypothetical protein